MADTSPLTQNQYVNDGQQMYGQQPNQEQHQNHQYPPYEPGLNYQQPYDQNYAQQQPINMQSQSSQPQYGSNPYPTQQPIMQAQQQQGFMPPNQQYQPPGYPQQGQQEYQLPTNANHMMMPARIECLTCKQQVTTIVNMEGGSGMWIVVGVTCIFCFPCAWVPCVVDKFKDRIHTCPVCRTVVGLKEFKPC